MDEEEYDEYEDYDYDEEEVEDEDDYCPCGYYCFDCLGMSWRDFM